MGDKHKEKKQHTPSQNTKKKHTSSQNTLCIGKTCLSNVPNTNLWSGELSKLVVPNIKHSEHYLEKRNAQGRKHIFYKEYRYNSFTRRNNLNFTNIGK